MSEADTNVAIGKGPALWIVSAFPDKLRLEALTPEELRARKSKRMIWRLLEPFTYHSSKFGSIHIPAGFEWDGASVPRILWSYLDPEDPCVLRASLVHDWLYSIAGRFALRAPLTRENSDEVFREVMILDDARPRQAAVAFWVVRAFGGSHWDKVEREEAA